MNLGDASDSTPSDAGAPAASGPALGHIGRYALKQHLGEGGLGTVYAAYDPILSRTIAVKTLHLSVADGDRATLDALFLNEARAAAGLNHPNIVTVYDAGLSEQGVYIAMERLRGRDLRQLLANGWRPDIAQTAQIVRRVADALSYAHSKGVIHCDIKPANIFMVGRTVPKVVDFGIARVAHGQDSPALDGMVAGSPHYLAPEQLAGETVDRRCDVYSLGVVMYELLTHRKAFDGRTLPEIVEAVKRGQPKAPHDLRPEVPTSLSAIAMRALSREPGERYRSARQMAQALRDWIESEADLAGDEAASPQPRNPRRLLIATLALGTLIGAGIGWQWLGESHEAESARAVAAAPASSSMVPATPASAGVGPATGTARTAAAIDEAAAKASAAVASAEAHAQVAAAARARAEQREKAAREARERQVREAAAKAAARPAPAPVGTGTVQLAVTPWGQIEVDGKSAGVTPPLAQLKLPVGEHTIVVRNADFAPLTLTVHVNADQPAVVRHRFGS
ncbi:MAG: serine/threonine protein kinase [Ideonella sp.]|nr:serine/threonine protein kinase [Ideonella sp.]